MWVSCYLCHSRYLIPVLVVLSNRPTVQEILWNFSHFNDEKIRLTLTDNPHFYAKLPTSPEAYGDSVRIDPIEDFQHGNKFYVLTDKPELVRIMTDQDKQFFGNFWCPQKAIIFKGLDVFVLFSPVSDVLPDICGRLRGGSIVKASLKGTRCGICTGQPSPMVEECMISCHPMDSSVDFGLCICTGRSELDNAVRCDITYLVTGSLIWT